MGMEWKIQIMISNLSSWATNRLTAIGVSKLGMRDLMGEKSKVKDAKFHFVGVSFTIRRISGLSGDTIALLF